MSAARIGGSMSRHNLTGRIDRIGRRLTPVDGVHIWLPLDDERDDLVRNTTTGEVLALVEVHRRDRGAIVVEYVEEGRPSCA